MFSALVLPTFTCGIDIWGGDLQNSHWKVFREGHDDTSYDVSRQRTLLKTYRILLARFGELPIELNALKLTMGFQQRLGHLPLLLVS